MRLLCYYQSALEITKCLIITEQLYAWLAKKIRAKNIPMQKLIRMQNWGLNGGTRQQ